MKASKFQLINGFQQLLHSNMNRWEQIQRRVENVRFLRDKFEFWRFGLNLFDLLLLLWKFLRYWMNIEIIHFYDFNFISWILNVYFSFSENTQQKFIRYQLLIILQITSWLLKHFFTSHWKFSTAHALKTATRKTVISNSPHVPLSQLVLKTRPSRAKKGEN